MTPFDEDDRTIHMRSAALHRIITEVADSQLYPWLSSEQCRRFLVLSVRRLLLDSPEGDPRSGVRAWSYEPCLGTGSAEADSI